MRGDGTYETVDCRYQIGDDVCGHIDWAKRKADAFAAAARSLGHLRRQMGDEAVVFVCDRMATRRHPCLWKLFSEIRDGILYDRCVEAAYRI